MDILVGKEESEAKSLLESKGWRWRVVELDGRTQGILDDIQADRVNLTIEDGIIKKAYIG